MQLICASKKISGQWYIVRFGNLSGYRKSYACMSYCIELYGGTANLELIGIDRPDDVKKIYQEAEDWLND